MDPHRLRRAAYHPASRRPERDPGQYSDRLLGRMRDDAREAGLVERARSGDQEAFGLLMDAHLERVWSLVWRVLRHREDTEDVVQEVFLTAWRSFAGFRGESSLATWLGKIAVTRALNHLDRRGEKIRRGSVPLLADADDVSQPGGRVIELMDARPGASPLKALEARELGRRLAECLGRLPAAWRAALALRHAEHQSY